MKDHESTSQPQPPYLKDDEIDLGAMVNRIWKARKIWLIAVLSVSILFWGWWWAKQINAYTPLVYSLPVQLHFKGIEDNTYPNGTPFNQSDLITPDIIKRASKNLNLEEYGVTLSDLLQSIRIFPMNGYLSLEHSLDSIKKRYSILTEEIKTRGKKATPEEILELDKEMKMYGHDQQEELERATLSGTVITLTTKEASVPENIFKNLLLDIPKVWAKEAINYKGVLDTRYLYPDIYTADKDVLSKLDYLIGVEFLRKKIIWCLENLKKVRDSHGLRAVDPETKMTATSFVSQVDNLLVYRLDPLRSLIMSVNVSKNPVASAQNFENQIQVLKAKRKQLMDEAKVISDIYHEYILSKTLSTSSKNQTVARESPVIQSGQAIMGDFLIERIFTMAERSPDIAYQQNLLSEQKAIKLDATRIASKLTDAKISLQSLNKSNVKSITTVTDRVQKDLQIIFTEAYRISQASQRILAEANSNNFNALYNNISSPSVSGGEIVPLTKKEKLIYILLLLATTIVVMLTAIIKTPKNQTDVVR